MADGLLHKGETTKWGGYHEKMAETEETTTAWQGDGTSIFDPVLCELAYKWFTPEGGAILDPFAGGGVRGIVAQYLGYKYTGVELRQEQVEANGMNAKEILSADNLPLWITGDSEKEIPKIKSKFDLLFSCPPYADLEVYSDLPEDISSKAKEYCKQTGAVKIEFGAAKLEYKIIIENRVRQVIKELGKEPDEIFCAIGSGTLVESILSATKTAKIIGVQVGKEYEVKNERLKAMKHYLPFEKESKYKQSFTSMPNYDLKAWEYCNLYRTKENVLFWNVL